MPRDVGVIVVAAGRGTRVGGEVPKQFLPVRGVPLARRALDPFLSHPDVGVIVLVLPAPDTLAPPAWLCDVPDGGAAVAITAGGAERSDSVAAGLDALPVDCAIVLVHDAARLFVERTVIDAVIAEARTGVGAVAAVPLSDTVKEAALDDPRRVARTVPRERLWRAQTPQGFPRDLLLEAHVAARRDGLGATDDAALVERIGGTVRLVPDSARNFKITSAADLALAELLVEDVR